MLVFIENVYKNVGNCIFFFQLNEFSNYLLHKNIQFSVSSLFSLDESLLISVRISIHLYIEIIHCQV